MEKSDEKSGICFTNCLPAGADEKSLNWIRIKGETIEKSGDSNSLYYLL